MAVDVMIYRWKSSRKNAKSDKPGTATETNRLRHNGRESITLQSLVDLGLEPKRF